MRGNGEDRTDKYISRVPATIVLTALMLAGSSAVLAQTPEELREINAAASATPTFVDRTARGGLTCDGGGVPTDFYFNDFEADDGGWSSTGAGDWEWGEVITGIAEGCDGAQPEPTGAFSGINAWATNLDGCYANSGDTATLTQTFDFSGLAAPIELSLQHWLHVFGDFDTAELLVNGDQLFLEDGATASSAYAPLAVDLSAYAGLASVTVEFNVNASTVVNRSGWYVDDLAITSCEPEGGVVPESTPVPALGPGWTLILAFAVLLAGVVVYRIRAG